MPLRTGKLIVDLSAPSFSTLKAELAALITKYDAKDAVHQFGFYDSVGTHGCFHHQSFLTIESSNAPYLTRKKAERFVDNFLRAAARKYIHNLHETDSGKSINVLQAQQHVLDLLSHQIIGMMKSAI